jgi:lyso-ornithine lipid O-acyltransferase
MNVSSKPGRDSSANRVERRPRLLPEAASYPGFLLNSPNGHTGWVVARRFRVARRGLAVVAWTILAMLLQAVFLAFPGRLKIDFARIYWAVLSRIIGIRVRVLGSVTAGSADRRVVFVSNHSSWIDIPVIGGVLDGCFVSKDDVATWPVISTIAKLGRTIFVSRSRSATGRERDAMRARLKQGDNLILFPEGTSSDGSRVLPFRTSFFALAELRTGENPADLPIIQPVSVVYDRLGGLPAGRANRPIFAWYGDMDLASHFCRLTQNTGLRATVLLHAPMDPARFADRKALSRAVWQVVADGASALRQNRQVQPLDVTPNAAPAAPKPALA